MKLPLIDVHAKAIEEKASVYHEFLIAYSNKSCDVYGFAEGVDDPSYYRTAIENTIPNQWTLKLWAAGGKTQVFKIYRQIDWADRPKKRICFFVDRDLSHLHPETRPEDTNIYTTQGYSLENDIVNNETVERTLKEMYGFELASQSDMDAIKNLFNEQFKLFTQSMILTMACILHWRKSDIRAKLDEIHMNNLFTFNDGRLTPQQIERDELITKLHNWCKLEPPTQAIDLDDLINVFSQPEIQATSIRGKYVFWFFIQFCATVKANSGTLCPRSPKPRKSKDWSHTKDLPHVAIRARQPDALRQFINDNYVAYIESATSTTLQQQDS